MKIAIIGSGISGLSVASRDERLGTGPAYAGSA